MIIHRSPDKPARIQGQGDTLPMVCAMGALTQSCVLLCGVGTVLVQRGHSSHTDNQTHNENSWNVLAVLKGDSRVLGRARLVG